MIPYTSLWVAPSWDADWKFALSCNIEALNFQLPWCTKIEILASLMLPMDCTNVELNLCNDNCVEMHNFDFLNTMNSRGEFKPALIVRGNSVSISFLNFYIQLNTYNNYYNYSRWQ